MDDIEICAFFCEDVRTEIGDKPIFLGVLSSVIMADEFPIDDGLVYVSMFFVPESISEFESHLKITLEGSEDRIIFETTRKLSRSSGSDTEHWLSINTFDFGDFELPEDGVLKAHVTAGQSKSVRYLKAKRSFEQSFDVDILAASPPN